MRHLLAITLVTFIISLLSTVLADAYLSERVPIVGDFIGLQYSRNPGIAWGMKLPDGLQEALIVAALVVVAMLAVREARKLTADSCQLSAFGFILGGGLANIIDRLRDGYVTDFIQIGTFPVFNVADSCVTIGVLLLLFGHLRRGKGHVLRGAGRDPTP